MCGRTGVAGTLDVDILELLRAPLEIWKGLEDDVVLIRLRVKGADLALSERVIESGVDLIRRNVEPRSCRPVVVQLHTETVVLLIRRDFSNLR